MLKTIKRRRKENKTDYLKRIRLLRSETPRIVLRRTNKHFIAHYTTSESAQDKIVFGMTSKELLKYGLSESAKGSLKSISTAYLFGVLIGKQILDKKLTTPIVDLGMMKTLHKSKPYAFLKGLIEAGLEINCKEEAFPSEERIRGEHLKNKINVEEIKLKILGK